MVPELTAMPGQLEFNTALSRLTILPGGSRGEWVKSLLPYPGSCSSPPSPGSLSYLAVAEENGSRAYCHAPVVAVNCSLFQVHYPSWLYEGGWVQSLLPCPGSWSSSPPSPGSLSYLAVAEEDGSRAYCHAQVVGVHHHPLQVHYPTWR